MQKHAFNFLKDVKDAELELEDLNLTPTRGCPPSFPEPPADGSKTGVEDLTPTRSCPLSSNNKRPVNNTQASGMFRTNLCLSESW
jgi:hypothetical protein